MVVLWRAWGKLLHSVVTPHLWHANLVIQRLHVALSSVRIAASAVHYELVNAETLTSMADLAACRC
jgi:hypothetical protein